MTKLLTNCDLTWMKLSVKYITTRKLLKIMYGLNYSNVKGPLVIPYSICARKNVIWRFVCTPNPSPPPPPPPFQERHENFCENFLPLT